MSGCDPVQGRVRGRGRSVHARGGIVLLGFGLLAGMPAPGSALAGPVQSDTVPADTLAPPDTVPRPDTLLLLPDTLLPPEPDTTPRAMDLFPDLSVRIRGRGEFGGDWARFHPCDAQVQLTCNPGLIPQLQPDLQFAVQLQGTVAERIRVDIDYDQTREFAAANRLNVFFEGRQGEFLQRFEVGDIAFDLPDSRFLGRGMPAGNFGVRAVAEAGPLEFQTLWAQQQGARTRREFRIDALGAEPGLVQEDTLTLDDADYARGQFFFLLDPAEIRGHPHLDVLALGPGDAPPTVAPGGAPIQLYRLERDPARLQQVEGFIQADARAEPTPGTGPGFGVGLPITESGWFRLLRPGVDYYLHPSGLWVALRSPLRPDEALAAAYVTQSGDTVGVYNPERLHNVGERPHLRLLRATAPNHQPGRPTWELEMRQIYRVSSSEAVDGSSVELTVSLGEPSGGRTFVRHPTGRDLPYLRLFGMDEEAPREELDRFRVFVPGEEGFDDRPPVPGAFVVFPTLRPFVDPGPVPSEGLSAPEALALLGAETNRRIYEAEDPFERENAGLYRLTIPHRLRGEAGISTFNLGAFGIRPGSERISLDERVLVPGVDYVIDYELGQVTLLSPEALVATAPEGALRVTWEQAAVFQVAPVAVFGANTRYRLGEDGDRGEINLIGLYQVEREILNRPRLGAEPGATGMGGLSGHYRMEAPWLDRALARVPGLRSDGGSTVRVEGEAALSLPNPNVAGAAYLDDFDTGDDRAISLLSPNWHLGSAPRFRDGADAVLPARLDETTVADLTWQHNWIVETPAGDSTGIFEGYFPQEDIDRQITVAGSQVREPGLLLTFGSRERPAPGDARWRSVTTLLGPSGADLSRAEFLEFYAAEGDSLTLVVDLGLVSEDAFFVDDEGRTSGLHPETGRPWGLDVLDQEADPMRGEVWSAATDRGLWNESCEARPGRVYAPGDPRANCTRGNGRPDTEDLNGNGVLDTTERHVRFVIRLDGSSPFVARDRTETGTRFRLYRIPLRAAAGMEVGGAFTEADWRQVQFLRVTVAGEHPGNVALARMKVVGSRWLKRGGEGVLRGIGGDTLGLGGRLEVTPVSLLSEGDAYAAPPGVRTELDDPSSAFTGRGIEVTERSLGLRYQDVAPGERAEVYHRFLQRPRDFLSYRRARLWVVAREGDWGPDEPLWFFMKVGTDPDNFYLFRERLDRAGNPARVSPDDWLPELLVEFQEWFLLRARAEERLVGRDPAEGPVVEWSADSTYAVVLTDRARAPNLAAVRELSMGVWNEGGVPTSGEIWMNELRLGGGTRDPGGATVLSLAMEGNGALDARLSVTGQSPFFQEHDRSPTYQRDRGVSFASTLRLDRLAPEEWGISVPLTIQHDRSDQDPSFLAGTDVRAGALPDLRDTGLRHTRASIGFRKDEPTGRPLADLVLLGLDARLGYTRTSGSTVTSRTASEGVDARLGYARSPEPRTVPILPRSARSLAHGFLPDALAGRLADARIRWTPTDVRVGTAYHRSQLRVTRFQEILVLPGLDAPEIGGSPREWLESSARVDFQPLRGITAGVDFLSTRDLLAPARSVGDPAVQELLAAERLTLAGMDLGWETHRSLRTRLGLRPQLAGWLRTELDMSTRYRSRQSPGLVGTAVVEGDTVPRLQRNLSGERDVRAAATLEPGALARSLLGEEGQGEAGRARAMRTGLGALQPVTVTWQDGVGSRFHRGAVRPGATYQLGLGGMDRFLTMDGDTAALLQDRRSLNTGSGIRLPGGVTTNVAFSRSRATAADRRGDRESRSRLWPDVRVSLAEVAPPGGAGRVIAGVGAGLGFQRSRQLQTFGVEGLQTRTQDDRRIPLDASIRWAGDLTTRYRGLVVRGDGSDPTGATERSQEEHTFTVSSTFRPPSRWAGDLDRPLRLAVHAQYSSHTDCRVTTGHESCVPYLDRLTRTLSVSLDSAISGIDLGLQASFTDRRSLTGFQLGSTQFQLGFWGRLLIEAGDQDPFGPAPVTPPPSPR